MSIEIVILGVLSFVVFLAFAAMLRIENDPALRYWSMAWGFMLLDRLLSVAAASLGATAFGNAISLSTYFTSPMIPFLLMFGAIVYSGRSIPRWLVVSVIAVAVSRCALATLGHVEAAHFVSLATEVPANVGSAVLVLMARQRSRSIVVQPILAGGYLAMAGFEAAVTWSVLSTGSALQLILVAASLAFYGAGSQLLAVFDRVWLREAEAERRRVLGLNLLREIARSSAGQSSRESFAMDAVELLRRSLGIVAGGIWLFDARSNQLNCAQSFGFPSSIMDRYRSTEVRGIVSTLLRRGAPIFSEDLPQEQVLFPGARRVGLQNGAVMPLTWHSEILGVVAVAVEDEEAFSASRRELYLAAAEELSLALHHIEALEVQSRQAEVLAHERQTLRAVLDISPAGIMVEDRDGKIAMWNPAARRHLDYGDGDDWRGKSTVELFQELGARLENGDADVARLRDVGDQDDVAGDVEISFRDPAGRTLILFTSAVHSADHVRLGRVWILRDISEERSLETQLHQAQKLDTLGRMAGGIAHDFNNQLTTILGNARILLRSEHKDPLEHESLVDLERAAKHCAGLTRSLLAFSRRTPITVRSLSVSEALTEVFELLRPLIPASIELVARADEDVENVVADPVQLQQIFVNLAVNARDSISDSGFVRIRASNCVVDSQRARSHPDATPGRFVEFCVSDDGAGIDPATLGRVFEPFFTTKTMEKGTGLGLAIVYGLVRSHDGWIEVESEVSVGTTVRVMLPAAIEGADAIVPAQQAATALGTETILLAEDNPGVRRLATRALINAGFRVRSASDGLEAVEHFREDADSIALILLDVEMPGMSGIDALRRMRELGAKQPVIFTSGHADQSICDTLGGDIVFLDKPYDPDDLANSVRRRIDRQGDRSRE